MEIPRSAHSEPGRREIREWHKSRRRSSSNSTPQNEEGGALVHTRAPRLLFIGVGVSWSGFRERKTDGHEETVAFECFGGAAGGCVTPGDCSAGRISALDFSVAGADDAGFGWKSGERSAPLGDTAAWRLYVLVFLVGAPRSRWPGGVARG